MKRIFWSVVAGAALSATAAQAGAPPTKNFVPSPAPRMVRPQDPGSIVAALVNAGYTAKLGVDATGDPMVTSGYGGTTFQVFFYNCTNHLNCATVQFHSGYTVTPRITLDQINDWNKSQRFGRAYLDKDGDPILEMDVDLDDGGVVPLLFIDNMEFWVAILPKFEKAIGYRK